LGSAFSGFGQKADSAREDARPTTPGAMKELCRSFRAWEFRLTDPGRRSQTRFALGYYLSGFQPLSLERQVEFFSPNWPSLENILPELKTVAAQRRLA